MSLKVPDSEAALRLIREAPGPSPWWCRGTVPSAFGALRWEQAKAPKPTGSNLLIDTENRPRLVLPMYVWLRLLDDGWMLLWRRHPSHGEPAQVIAELIQLDNLKVLTHIEERVSQASSQQRPIFDIAPGFASTFEMITAMSPGTHSLDMPEAFQRVPEFFIISENAALPQKPGTASCCIYAIDPGRQTVEVIPQDWFNDGRLDYGYQWITCAARDSESKRLIVGGIRIDNFILDEAGRQIDVRLPR